jgi:bis(5'-nucleosidyl)-tetraphosphatase
LTPDPTPPDTGAQRGEERSAGALVFHQSPSGRRYLLLKYPAGHWDFPKGNIEKGELPEQTMVREVREETGLVDIVPVEGFRKVIEYFYKRDGRTVHKQVTFFLAESPLDRVVLSFEHRDYAWLTFEEAMKLVTYSNSTMLLRAAEDSFRRRRSSG